MQNRAKSVHCAWNVKPPCNAKCKQQCSKSFTGEERQEFFEKYWNLGDIDKKREYIANNTMKLEPKYRTVRVGGKIPQPRENNRAFYMFKNNNKVRV